MKIKRILFIIMFFALILPSMGQGEKKKLIYIDAGIDFIGCNVPEKDYIRDDINPYYYYYYYDYFDDNSADQINAMCYKNYFSIKGEYKILK